MAENARATPFAPPRPRSDMRELSRVAAWGLAALASLTLATYAASFDVAEDRLVLAVASIRGVPPPERLARAPSGPDTDKIANLVRELSADRDQLLARLDMIERNVGDITSSISRTPVPAVTSTPALPTPAIAPEPPPEVSAPANIPASLPALQTAQPAQAAEEPAATRPEFGIDLGRATTIEGLRQLWAGAMGRHGGVLEGLRPIVTVREIARPSSGIELRLVAGPIANAAAAARLCAALAGAPCHPTVFDGQRLALR